jgi:D-beta-D-heptose 7-phosphate kinase/D-beta-D-heptose 1-phosphate adenosyltransferase
MSGSELTGLLDLLDRFTGRRMLVLGDVILDRYWWGESHRLSPEAPVPIVRKQRSTVRPGGAANTAANLVALGASAEVCGVVGVDDVARELRAVLAECEIGAALVADSTRPTTSKTRIVALHQQVVRVDEEDTHPLADALAAEVLSGVQKRMGQCHGVVLSDYAKGFLTPEMLRAVIDGAARANVKTFIDPKGPDYERYRGCSLLKPNRLELALLTRMPVRNHEETLAAGRTLASQMAGTGILVTEGTDGMTLFCADGSEEHAAPILKQVFDVTGAGDTVLAAVALAISSGGTARQALHLASHAASLAVGVIGTAAVTRAELAAALGSARP